MKKKKRNGEAFWRLASEPQPPSGVLRGRLKVFCLQLSFEALPEIFRGRLRVFCSQTSFKRSRTVKVRWAGPEFSALRPSLAPLTLKETWSDLFDESIIHSKESLRIPGCGYTWVVGRFFSTHLKSRVRRTRGKEIDVGSNPVILFLLHEYSGNDYLRVQVYISIETL